MVSNTGTLISRPLSQLIVQLILEQEESNGFLLSHYKISNLLSFLLDIKLHFTLIKWKDRLSIISLGEALGVDLPSGQYGGGGLPYAIK